MDRELALEALGALCNANVTSFQKEKRDGNSQKKPTGPQLFVKQFIVKVLDADETCLVAKGNFDRMKTAMGSGGSKAPTPQGTADVDIPAGSPIIIDEDEFFDPRFDFDFSSLKDVETFYRGGEVYERPCGWYRFALKVLDKYDDGNAWLGTRYRSTQSVPGEWPVSYHGTSKKGAEGIIEGFYLAGSGQAYGRGIYSTPYLAEALYYTKTFTSVKDGKKYRVILQNRINADYRTKHNNGKYWLIPIPAGSDIIAEQELVERGIRPYGLLVKQV